MTQDWTGLPDKTFVRHKILGKERVSYMKKFISIKFLGPMFALTVLALSYQNCSKVSVDTMESASIASTAGTSSPPDVICNPLSGATCDIDSKEGLIGNLYYLTQDQAPLFSNNLNNAKLADYITYGHKPDSLILMN